MSWFRWRRIVEAPRPEQPEQRPNYSIADPAVALLLGYGDGIGPSVSEHTALTLSAVWRAVSLIAGSVAALPLRVLADSPDGARERVPSFLDNPASRDGLTSFEWVELVLVHLLLHGNAFLQIIRNGAGATTALLPALLPLHPLCVEVVADLEVPGGKRFVVTLDDGTRRELDTRDLVHITGVTLDGLRGCSPIALARTSLGTGLSGDRAASRLFINGARVSGLVTPEDDLTEDEAELIGKSLRARIAGTGNTGDIAVINRRLRFQQWSLSAEDAQFLESRAFQVEEVARWFGLPPHLLAQVDKQASWGTGVAEQNRGLARYTFTPWTSRIEARLTRLLPAGRFAEFDFTALVRPAPEVEIPLLLAQVTGGLISVEEARRVRNLPPRPEVGELREPQANPAPGGTA